VRRGHAIALVAAAAAAPRLLVLAFEREEILTQLTEKSDRFAQTLASSGTLGFLPGVPSAYTQPLYTWFLAGLYWAFGRSWPVVGLAQVTIAVATALLVLELGRRVHSQAAGAAAALIATLHPYAVWHDVHVNREILDGLLAVALTLLVFLASERRSPTLALAAGAATGLAILGNARLALLPLVLAGFLLWTFRPRQAAPLAAAGLLAAAALVVSPWIVRNQLSVGCATLTTDARALWKANNPATYDVLASGRWIDDVPELPGAPPWPELAADLTLGGTPTRVDECAQLRLYRDEVLDFWREQPGEKGRLALQAAGMLWRPTFTVESPDPDPSALQRAARSVVEPLSMSLVYALALGGALLLPRRYLALTLLLLAYGTLAAAVFAGTVRYRVPWDFLLAVPAALALLRLGAWARRRSEVAA
jgi:4-amino-4-deoxy-L-arabinose transferase-like glycosyltransferase